MTKQYRTAQGFTLIELAITILIISILTILATNLYTPFVRKGRRMDATNTLFAIQLAEERYRSNNTQYGTLAQAWGGVTATPQGYYTLAISNVGATTYTITATAVGGQANDTENGVSCTPLTLTLSSGTITQSPATCWPY